MQRLAKLFRQVLVENDLTHVVKETGDEEFFLFFQAKADEIERLEAEIGEAQSEWGQSGKMGGVQRLRLSLTWAPDSTDGPDEASVLVDTVIFAPVIGD